MPPVDGSSPFPLLPRMCLDLRGTEDALFIHMCFSVSLDAQHFLEKPQCDDLTFHMSDDATSPVLPSNNHSSPQSHDPQKTSEHLFWLTFVKTQNVLIVYFSCSQASFLIFLCSSMKLFLLIGAGIWHVLTVNTLSSTKGRIRTKLLSCREPTFLNREKGLFPVLRHTAQKMLPLAICLYMEQHKGRISQKYDQIAFS